MKTVLAVLAAGLTALPALAHTGEHVHAHPHGSEGAIALMVLALAGLGYAALRR
ncbi:peptidase M23 [Actibacterium mucosum]|uniref:peptidase M23 n=1 Tax=Actibacterium mucosum TaxID=1087332 RepID=UPI00126929DC|nr:peptidase M23 [Actibacterium mucosum]